MFLIERQRAILAYLDKHEKGTVEYFANQFNVSKETIRKDLSALAKQHLITRCHGGAMILRHQFTRTVTSAENISALLTQYKKQKILLPKLVKTNLASLLMITSLHQKLTHLPYISHKLSLPVMR